MRQVSRIYLLCLILIETVCLSGCKKDDTRISDEATVSVGKLSEENATLRVIVTEEGGSQEIIGVDELKARRYKIGTKLKIGLQIYKNGKLYAETKEGSSECPFQEKYLEAGKNKLQMVVCRVDGGGTIETEIDNPEEENPSNPPDHSDPSGSTPSSSEPKPEKNYLTTSVDCTGKSVTDMASATCTSITKDLSKDETIYSECFSQLDSLCDGDKYSEVKCVVKANVEAYVYVTCAVELESKTGCKYSKGVIECPDTKVSAVKAAKVKYL